MARHTSRPSELRQVEIEDHEIGSFVAKDGERLLSVRGCQHAKAALLQISAHDFDDFDFVVDNENLLAHIFIVN